VTSLGEILRTSTSRSAPGNIQFPPCEPGSLVSLVTSLWAWRREIEVQIPAGEEISLFAAVLEPAGTWR
jgi:hypothetical protein